MAPAVSEMLLERFSKFVAEGIGLHFPRERWRDLERGISSTAKELGYQDAETLVQQALSLPLPRNQLEILASNLTVGETYLYRENKAYEALEKHILPALLRSSRINGKYLRMWSAGCCTGEEPYSLAISISKAIPDWKSWNITVLATDINSRFLQKAAQATYGEWSFRDAPEWLKDRYLTKVKEGRYEIIPGIRKMVTFSHLNLAEDVYPSLLNNTNAMDIIFCRNVLMYFTPEQAKRAIQKLYHSLVDGGWLVISSVETSPVLYSQFTTVNFNGLTIYRKTSSFQSSYLVTDHNARPDLTIHALESRLATPEPQPVPASRPEPLTPSAVNKKKVKMAQPNPYEEALALYEGGLYAEAVDKLLVSLPSIQSNSAAMSLLARVYANQGKLAEALEWCEKAMASNKLNPILYYLQATILQEQGNMAAATEALNRTLYLDREFVLAHIALGNLSLRQGKSRQADKHFENALLLLETYPKEALIPESEGITASRLIDIVSSTRYMERQS